MKKIELVLEESVGVVLGYRPSSISFNSKTTNTEYFLLLKNLGGGWNFVKGHREENESDYDTLKREIFEETGIFDFKVLSYLDKIEYEFRKKNGVKVKKEVKFYYASTNTTNVLLSKEHLEYIWLKYRQAKRLISFYESKLLLEKVFMSGLSY
jgi:tRNA nucleotidyltransferase (CCA-adding enzyme)